MGYVLEYPKILGTNETLSDSFEISRHQFHKSTYK